MVIDRRQLLTSMLATLCAGGNVMADAKQDLLFVSCRMDAEDNASVACFDKEGREVFATALPARGHDVTQRLGADEIVVFARRPGNWFAVIGAGNGQLRQVVQAPEGRHFYGHGAFSADQQLLQVTENDIVTGNGVIGIYDATNGYIRIGEFSSGGIGPHDIALMPDGRTLVIANGGLRTHPATGRETLNPGDMKPNLAYYDLRHGECVGIHELSPDLRQLSIRHLAVRQDGLVAFGCQYQGDPNDAPPLLGTVDADGTVRLLEVGEDALYRMMNYVGSVTFDEEGRYLVATSPQGGSALLWDMSANRLRGSIVMPDVCGAAPSGKASFILSSGHAQLKAIAAGGAAHDVATANWIWDNHLRRLEIG